MSEELRKRLTALAETITAIKSEDYDANATELFDLEDAALLTEAVARLEQIAILKQEWERECADTDRILIGLGCSVETSRTEGGSLRVNDILIKCAERESRIGWLIETGNPPLYWDSHAVDGYTSDPNKAIRFARKEDAEVVRCWLIPAGERWKSVEHMWLTAPPEPRKDGGQ